MQKFQFFNSNQVSLIADRNITASASHQEAIWFNKEGSIVKHDATLKPVSTIKAFKVSIQFIHHISTINHISTLLCIGYDEPGIQTLKQYASEKLMKSIKIQSGKQSNVSALGVYGNLIALGLENGTCLVLGNEKESTKFTKFKTVFEGPLLITGVGFSVVRKEVRLFIVTSGNVLVVDLNERDVDRVKIISEVGAEIGCSLVSSRVRDQSMIVARNNVKHAFHFLTIGNIDI